MNTLAFTIKRTQMRLAREMLLRLYPKAIDEWGAWIQRFDELDAHADRHKPISSTQADDDLAAWLENMKLEDGADDPMHRECTHPRISVNNVSLYRCSWCGNPSAVLRKCGGCGKTRYCDGQCQKKHWSEHRTDCKGK
uniref:Serine hydroxymethyltransferase (EC) n=1 Tax=Ganoderma boninense TaxID=34458 RepID=A0A5K1K4A2_9APHY|nr:Serine hydroxymethyltransferase (EC [Ganoderma boninense]